MKAPDGLFVAFAGNLASFPPPVVRQVSDGLVGSKERARFRSKLEPIGALFAKRGGGALRAFGLDAPDLDVGRLRGRGGLLRDGGASALRVAPLEGDAEARHHGAAPGRRGGGAAVADRASRPPGAKHSKRCVKPCDH